MVKKILAVLCVLSIMVGVLPSALAEEFLPQELTAEFFVEECTPLPERPTGGALMEVEYKTLESNEEYRGISLFSQARSVTEEDVYLYLVEAIKNRELAAFFGEGDEHYGVDLRRLNIPAENIGIVEDATMRAFYFHPELLIYNSYNIWNNAGKIAYVEVIYMFEEEEEEAQKKAVLDAIDGYKELANDVPDTVGKMLVIHDELAKKCRYATAELAKIKENGIDDITENQIYTGYGALVNNVAVCQGYAIVLAKIFSELGIENVLCRNEDKKINHIWNMVKIDGEWYNIDATWNDSDTKDSSGNLMTGAYHTWFLITDEKTVETGHGPTSDWIISGHEKDISCTSTKYESGYIFSSEHIYTGEDAETQTETTINYGDWYGDITYGDGRYKINVIFYRGYSAEDNILYNYLVSTPGFYSFGIKSNGLIATEKFRMTIAAGQTADVIGYFSTSDILGVDVIFAKYESGVYKGKVGGQLFKSMPASKVLYVQMPTDERKVMLWKSGTQEPVAEARRTIQ